MELQIGDKLKELFGVVGENVEKLKKDLTPTPLPSGSDVWEAGKKNGDTMKEDILKNKSAEMAMDVLPMGAAVGMIKRVKSPWTLKGFSDDTMTRFHNKLGDVYDESFSPTEAFQAALKSANSKEAAVLRALEKDDFLGFDYPHQALNAVLENPENFDISPVLKAQITKMGNPPTVKPAAKELLPERYMRLFNKEKVSSTLQDVLDPKSRSTIVYMTPDDFLKVAYPREKTYASLTQAQRMALGEEKRAPIRKAIKEGGLNDIPKLFTDAGQVTGHEGRHRMDVFKELGYERIPVEVRDTMYRWGENPPPYKELISETGEATVGMPKSVVWDKAE